LGPLGPVVIGREPMEKSCESLLVTGGKGKDEVFKQPFQNACVHGGQRRGGGGGWGYGAVCPKEKKFFKQRRSKGKTKRCSKKGKWEKDQGQQYRVVDSKFQGGKNSISRRAGSERGMITTC